MMLISYFVATTAFAKGVTIGGAATWLLVNNYRQRSA
jgi:hypothetical protein